MSAYKVAYALEDKMVKTYKRYGINFAEKNGSNGNNLPVTAVYIVDRSGKITYGYYDENYKVRLSVQSITTHL